jgi:hypothetical protein
MEYIFRISESSNPKITAFLNYIRTLDFVQEEKIYDTSIYGLTNEHQQIIEQRMAEHLSGESKSYTWEEVKANARKAFHDKKKQ